MEPGTESNLFELQLDQEAMSYLKETARWAKFFAIVGFIFCGLMVLAALSGHTSYQNAFTASDQLINYTETNSVFGVVLFLALAVVYFFPCLYLLRYSSKMQTALKHNDQLLLNQSFRNLKSWFRFVGILMIVTIGLFLLLFILSLLSAGFH